MQALVVIENLRLLTRCVELLSFQIQSCLELRKLDNKGAAATKMPFQGYFQAIPVPHPDYQRE